MISVVLGTGVAVINKTKEIYSLCGLDVSSVKIGGNFYLKKKTKIALQKGKTDIETYRQ